MRDDSAQILFQSFLQEALVSSSGIGRDVHFLMLSIQLFLCRPRRRPPSKVSWRMVLERLSGRVTCPNHASFLLLTGARTGSCGPTRELILFRTQSLVLCSKELWRSFFMHSVGLHTYTHMPSLWYVHLHIQHMCVCVYSCKTVFMCFFLMLVSRVTAFVYVFILVFRESGATSVGCIFVLLFHVVVLSRSSLCTRRCKHELCRVEFFTRRM